MVGRDVLSIVVWSLSAAVGASKRKRRKRQKRKKEREKDEVSSRWKVTETTSESLIMKR